MGPATDKHQAPTQRLKLYVRAIIESEACLAGVIMLDDNSQEMRCFQNISIRLSFLFYFFEKGGKCILTSLILIGYIR